MANALKNRSEMEPKNLWRLDHIYSTDALWEEDFEKVMQMTEEMGAFSGKLGESAEALSEAITKSLELGRLFEKVYVYAQMKSHEDSSEGKYQAFSSKADTLASVVATASSFLAPEILAIPDEKMENFLTHEKLELYRRYLGEIIRNKPHVLSGDEERLLAMSREVTGTAESVFNMLNNADITFPDILDEDGSALSVTKGRYILLLEHESRKVRKAAFESLYGSYFKQRNTLGALLYGNVKGNLFVSSARKFPGAREAALFDSNVNVAVYDNLIKSVHDNLGLLHRYMKLRKKTMGLEELHLYDIYTPMVQAANAVIPYEEAVTTVKKGLGILGEDYVADMEKAFTDGWIDVYENKGKRSGAYSWGCYDSHPYILLNHGDNINNMFTLAHELGHAMHSFYSDKAQPYVDSQYKIFVAEVASTCNEALLMDELLKTTTNRELKLQLMNYFMEQFRGTIFRQTMFAEFEQITHERAAAGEALTADLFSEIYLGLNRKYFGDEVVIDEEIAMEWARIPHFYNSFYVYQYATGFSAAMALSKGIIEKKEGAKERYLNFLKSGGSDYPVELLKNAGVDMNTPEPINNALEIFGSLIDEMETLLNQPEVC